MNIKTALAAALLASATLPSPAQTAAPAPAVAEQMKQAMQTTMGTMVTVMGPMTEAMIEAQLTVAARPETAARIASFKKNLYDALLKQGFNGIDAMKIVVTTPLPGAAPASK